MVCRSGLEAPTKTVICGGAMNVPPKRQGDGKHVVQYWHLIFMVSVLVMFHLTNAYCFHVGNSETHRAEGICIASAA